MERTGTRTALMGIALLMAMQVMGQDCTEWKRRHARAVHVLDSTRAVGRRLLTAKDSRIAELERLSDNRIAAALRQSGEVRSRHEALVGWLKTEALTKRFLGWGRKRAIRKELKRMGAL
ncbi:hypothetical protein [Rudanella lutea]|uniref:hypothetical protein n=1 Tax=Rudanella lutea TaxID=451374 RepID=UPI0012FCC2D6|nr:hypothetical protein [Rudanella lutea]